MILCTILIKKINITTIGMFYYLLVYNTFYTLRILFSIFNISIRLMKRMRKCLERGLLFWFPLNTRGLTKEEIRRQRQLWKRNAFNGCYVKEAEAVIGNAEAVETAGVIDCPILMFVSNGKEVSSNWRANCQRFAGQMHAEMVLLDCGHYVHHYASDIISREMERFIARTVNRT